MFAALLSIVFGFSLIAGTGQTPDDYRASQPQCPNVWIAGREPSGVVTYWFSALPAHWNSHDVLDPERGYWIYCGDAYLPSWQATIVEHICQAFALPECDTFAWRQ